MIISAFSMVYAGGIFTSTGVSEVTANSSNTSVNLASVSSQAVHVSNQKLMPEIDASQVSLNMLNSNNNIKYFGQQYLDSTVVQQKFPVYFNQTGLPLGDQWNITINGTLVHTFNISYLIYLPQGKYNYSISRSGDFYPAVGEGALDILSSGAVVQVYFQPSIIVNSTMVVDNSSFVQGIQYSNEMNYGPYSALYNPFNGFYYVANKGNGSVSILNGVTDQVYKIIKVGSRPLSMTVDPYNGNVYVANSGGSTVSVINSNLLLFENLSIMQSPSDVLFDPVSGYLFVSNYSNLVSVLSPNGTVTYTTFNSDVSQLVFDSSNGNVFVRTSLISISNDMINAYSKQVYYISSTGKIIDGFNISANIILNSIAFDSAENALYSVTALEPNNNLVITNSSGTVLQRFTLSYSPYEIYYDSLSGNIFILGFSNETTSIYSYSGGMNFMGSMYLQGEIQDIAFSVRGLIIPDSNEGDVYSASPITTTREVSLTERGLNPGTQWGFTYSGHKYLTSSENINFTALFSSLNIQFLNVTGYVLNNGLTIPSGNITLKYIVQYQRTYQVVISETGLPSGTVWTAYINNNIFSSNNETIRTNLTNGTYSLFLSRSGDYYPNPSNITLVINGSGADESIVFSASTFTVNFHEEGLPSGSVWYLNLSNGAHIVSQNHNISLILPNDTYYYKVSSGNKTFKPFQNYGSFKVKGASLNSTLNFIMVTYTIKVTETGLPSNILWYFHLDTSGNSAGLTNSSISISLQNGSYSYYVKSSDNQYYPVQPSGSFTVNGADLDLKIVFKEATFKILFSESGLPSGIPWFVNISNELNIKTANSPVSIMLPNGTYHYSVSVANKTFEPLNPLSEFVVNGSSAVVNVGFKMVLYSVRISIKSIPINTNWSLNINGKNISTYSAQETLLSLSNGTYNYEINMWNHIYRSTSGNFSVNGYNETVNVHISTVKYSITVNEKGLPEDSLWYLNLSDGVKLYSYNDIMAIELTNGTYIYAISSGNSSFHPSIAEGKIAVSGSNITMTEDFDPTLFNVTFSGQNYYPGDWYVNLSNGDKSGPIFPNASHNFNLTNGTYSFVIGISNGSYRPSLTSGIFTVNGSNLLIPVSFSEVKYTITFTNNLKNSAWQVEIGNDNITSFSGGPIVFHLSNGTYTYSALMSLSVANGKYIPEVNGTFTVSGKNVSLEVFFKKLQKVYINVIAPPPNLDWVLSINGTFYRSGLPSMIIELPDGNYSSYFSFNFTFPALNNGPLKQNSMQQNNFYINVTVPFDLNVTNSMFVTVLFIPSPAHLYIFIISGPALPPPPFGPVPPLVPLVPFNGPMPGLPDQFVINFLPHGDYFIYVASCINRPGFPLV